MKLPSPESWRLAREMILFGVGIPAFIWEFTGEARPVMLGFIGMLLGLPVPLAIDRVRRGGVDKTPEASQ